MKKPGRVDATRLLLLALLLVAIHHAADFVLPALVLAHRRPSEPFAPLFALLRRFLDDIAAGPLFDEVLDLVFMRGEVLCRGIEQRVERSLALAFALQGESSFLPGDILVLRLA